MPSNPVRGFQDRFMQKPEGVFYLDMLCAGRKTIERPVGPLFHQLGMRTGFFSGHINIGEVPNAKIKKFSSIHNPEGITVILPFRKGSPGWKIFHDLPLAQLSEMQSRLEEVTIQLANAVEAAQDIRSTEQLKQLLFNVYDMFKGWKNDVEIPEQMMVQPKPADKGKEGNQ